MSSKERKLKREREREYTRWKPHFSRIWFTRILLKHPHFANKRALILKNNNNRLISNIDERIVLMRNIYQTPDILERMKSDALERSWNYISQPCCEERRNHHHISSYVITFFFGICHCCHLVSTYHGL